MNEHKHREMNANNTRGDFLSQWEYRKQAWRQEAERNAPDDATLLEMAHRAQSIPIVTTEEDILSLTFKRRGRWLPYVSAAILVAGISIIGLTRQGTTPKPIPEAKEVTVEGQTLRFMCNNGCSAQDVLLSANEVIKNREK